MIQLQIVSGTTAGQSWTARRFPVRVGRAPDNDLRLEADGVFDHHFEIALDGELGFLLGLQPAALATDNHQPAARPQPLRNGDTIECGAARLRFWLAEAPRRQLRASEWFVWTLVVLVCAVQVALVYWLTG
jgi:pSer/pThr/pTyr-binding forkhead associated (FHA) protein